MKNCILLITLYLLVSCSSDDSDLKEKKLSGYYRIISIKGDTPVDLNNDGVKSTDVYTEITSPHINMDGALSFYDFNSIQNFAEFRPLKNSTNNGKLADFRFPSQEIGQLSDETYYLMSYRHSFIAYEYEFISQSEIKLSGSDHESGVLQSFKQSDNGLLSLTLTKRVFDFVDQAWITIELVAEYQKDH